MPADSRFSSDKQTPVPPSSHVEVMQHKPSLPGLSPWVEKDTQQNPLSSNAFTTLGHVEEAHQKQMTSRQSVCLGHEEEAHKKLLRQESSTTTGHCEETCQKSLDAFAFADETSPKTHLAVSHSIIPNASDDSDDESLKKPKYNTHVMLPDRQYLERHAGTLLDIYNDIHSKELILQTTVTMFMASLSFKILENEDFTTNFVLFLTLFSINNFTNNSVLVN